MEWSDSRVKAHATLQESHQYQMWNDDHSNELEFMQRRSDVGMQQRSVLFRLQVPHYFRALPSFDATVKDDGTLAAYTKMLNKMNHSVL